MSGRKRSLLPTAGRHVRKYFEGELGMVGHFLSQAGGIRIDPHGVGSVPGLFAGGIASDMCCAPLTLFRPISWVHKPPVAERVRVLPSMPRSNQDRLLTGER